MRGASMNGFIIPLWIPTLIVVVATVFFHRRARPKRPGHCLKCDYNLIGNESGVCPECGTSILQQSNGDAGLAQ